MQYNHTVAKHNIQSPAEIAPFVYDLIKPQSVIDVGCGLGSFLKAFKQMGVKKVMGIDGKWCNKELLFENITANEFLEKDLEKPINIGKKFDLAISTEVAEHLTVERANSFVDDLTNLSDIVLFSAAIPNQGGDHHYNEQWIDYWESKFSRYNFVMYDVLRPQFWNNDQIFWWYRQNMVLFIKQDKNVQGLDSLSSGNMKRVVHPQLYSTVMDYKDRNAIKRYLKLLFKALTYRFGLRN